MVSTQTTSVQEVSPEFKEYCSSVLDDWKTGTLPFQEAVARLKEYSLEAVATDHYANQGNTEIILGIMQGYRANLNESIFHFERARELFERAGNRERMTACILNIGETYRLKGNFTRARTFFHAAYETARELGQVSAQVVALTNEGQMLLSMKRLDKARDTLEKACELSGKWEIETPRDVRDQLDNRCEIYYALAAICLREGQFEAAWERAMLSLEAAEKLQLPIRFGYARRVIAKVISELGKAPVEGFSSDPDEHFRAASEAFREVKAEGELAKTMFVHGNSLAKRGKQRAAARKLQQAMIIFTRLGMVDDAARAAEAQLELI